MDQTQTEQPEKCSRCHEFPEDILMLACSHDLCLLCAATVFTAPESSIPRQNNLLKALRCEQCGSLTQLDQSSVYELEKLIPAAKMHQSQQMKMQTTPQHVGITAGSTPQKSQLGLSGSQKNEILQKYKIQDKKSYEYGVQPLVPVQQTAPQPRYQEKLPLSSMAGSASKKNKVLCLSHPDEKISYFCYDCETNCICPECVIHGAHKNHDVGTVKKAYPIILKKMEEKVDEVNQKMSDVKGFQEKFNQRKSEVLEQGRQKKKQISDAFNELRIILDKKEKELLENQSKSEQDFLKFLEVDFNFITQRLGQFNNELETMTSQMNQRDQIALLNFFADQNKSQEANAQNDEQFFKKIQQDYEESQSKKTFDSNSTLTQLNQMVLSISAGDPLASQKNFMRGSADFAQLNQSSEIKKSNQQSNNKYIPDNKSNQSQTGQYQNY